MSSENRFGPQSRLVRPRRDLSAAGSFAGSLSGLPLVFASIAISSRCDSPASLLLSVPRWNRQSRAADRGLPYTVRSRSEEHTSELQSLMSISYAVFCLKKNTHYICSILQYKI